MNIQRISGYQPNYTSVEQVRRGEPVTEPNVPNGSDLIEHKIEKIAWKDKFKYDWKTMSAITAGAAVVLLGVFNRRAIGGMVKKIFKPEQVKKKYVTPEIKITNIPNEKVVKIPESEITITMPEPKVKPAQSRKPKEPVYINEQGQIINPHKQNSQQRTGFNFEQKEEMFGRKPAGNPTSASDIASETADRMVDFVIIDDIINGGKEVESGVNFVKNLFKGSAEAPVADDIVGKSGIIDDIASGVERSEGIIDSIADGLSDIGSSIIDGLGDIV